MDKIAGAAKPAAERLTYARPQQINAPQTQGE